MSNIRLPEINRIQMVGRLTDKPELSFTPSGKARAVMRLASNRLVKSGDSEKQQETTYITIVAWNKIADVCAEYLAKGSAIYVEGKLRSRLWQRPDNLTQTLYEIQAESIQFLDARDDS